MNQFENIQIMRENILNWVKTLHVKNNPYGIYKMSKSTEPTLFSSCFAVFLRNLFNDLEDIPLKELDEWVKFIRDCQDKETGLFIDPKLKYEGKFKKDLGTDHGFGYITWQSTTFCLSALDALGAEKKYPLSILDFWIEDHKIESWLSGLDWKKSTWCNGNLAMFLGIILIHGHRSSNSSLIGNCLDQFFEWHDRNQDPNTGFWGTDQGTPIDNGLFGAMHQYLLYYYANRKINYMDRIIDSTLLLQHDDGLFSAQGGGDGCMDLDAIDTLVNMHMLTNYKQNHIKLAMKKAFTSTLGLLANDGGFLWARRYKFGIKNWGALGASVLCHRNLNYWSNSCKNALIGQFISYNKPRLSPGWTTSPIPMDESDLFSTWFRCLNLALISQIFKDCPYREFNWGFLQSPGLGYFRKRI